MLEAIHVGDCYSIKVPDKVELPLETIPYVFGFLINIECHKVEVACLLASHYRGLFRVVVINGTVVSTTEYDYPLGASLEKIDRDMEREQNKLVDYHR